MSKRLTSAWMLLAWAFVGGSALAQVHQGTPFTRKVEPPTRGDEFRLPRAVHADLHTGELFVCDTFNNRILIFDHRGFFRFQITGGMEFRSPIDVAVDDRGFLFVLAASGGRRGVVLMDFDGKIVGQVHLTGLPNNLPEPRLTSIALSSSGDRLYAVDEESKRLWIATRNGEVLSSVDLSVGIDPEEVEELRLGHVDVYGETVLVAVPTTGKVWLLDLDGTSIRKIGERGTTSCQLAYPVTAALDAEGKLLVLDKQRALYMRWDPETNQCLGEFSGFGNVPGALYQPGDLSLDDSGSIYISQGFEGRVQVFRALASAPPLLEALQLVPTGSLLGSGWDGSDQEEIVRRLEEAVRTNEGQRQEFRALDSSHKELQGELDTARARLEELEFWHAVVIEALTDRLDEARSSQTANEAALAATQSQLAATAERSVGMLAEVEALEARQQELEAEAGQARAEAVRFRKEAATELARLDEVIAEKQEQLAALDAERKELVAEVDNLLEDNASLATERDDLLVQISEAHQGPGPAEERAVEAEREVTALRVALATRGDDGEEPAAPVPQQPLPSAQGESEPGPESEADQQRGEPAEAVSRVSPIELVEAAVRAWADAWTWQRVDAYLSSYSVTFRPPESLSRLDWERQRHSRLTRPTVIEVSIDKLDIEMTGPREARVVFDQSYRSDVFADKVRKTLLMVLEPSGWKILSEQVDEVY